MAPIEKRRRQANLENLTEPSLTEKQKLHFQRGIDLFNSGKFWDAHEAWEAVWQSQTENNRIFFQGLIQVAAGCHQFERRILHGFDKHVRNALWKLEPFSSPCLGIDMSRLVSSLKTFHSQITDNGISSPEQIKHLLPLPVARPRH